MAKVEAETKSSRPLGMADSNRIVLRALVGRGLGNSGLVAGHFDGGLGVLYRNSGRAK